MAYKFNITRGNAILNFSEEFCQKSLSIKLKVSLLRKFLEKYIKHIKRTDTTIYEYLHAIEEDDVDLLRDLRDVFKLLLVMSVEEVCAMRSQTKAYFKDRDMFIALVEDIYLFWRRLQRYAIVFNETKKSRLSKCSVCRCTK